MRSHRELYGYCGVYLHGMSPPHLVPPIIKIDNPSQCGVTLRNARKYRPRYEKMCRRPPDKSVEIQC